MKYMLDTNICIYLLKGIYKEVEKTFKSYRKEDLCISSITLSELEYGIYNSQKINQNALAVSRFVSGISILPYDSNSCIQYGIIKSKLVKEGKIIGPLDMLIAAHAKAANLTLVTNNVSEFERVEGLKIENWI